MTNFKKREIIPITICVLQRCIVAYLLYGYRVVIIKDFPDLMGEPEFNLLDDRAAALLESYEDNWIDDIRCITDEIVIARDSIARLYGLKLDDLMLKGESWRMADAFYQQILTDEIKAFDADPTNEVDNNYYINCLSASIKTVISCLGELILRGNIDLEEAAYRDVHFFLNGNYEFATHAKALQELQDLGWRLQEDDGDIINLNI